MKHGLGDCIRILGDRAIGLLHVTQSFSMSDGFLKRCPRLERISAQYGVNDIETRILLLFGERGNDAIGNTKKYLADIWRRRESTREQARRDQD